MPLEAKSAPRPAKVAGRVYPSDRPRVNCAFSGVLSAACFQRRQLWRGCAVRRHPRVGGRPPASWIPAFAGTCPDAFVGMATATHCGPLQPFFTGSGTVRGR